MRFLSACSGIEAATVAWRPLGWEPVAYSEIEPFACAVLKHHYPEVPNLGDMTKFKEWPDYAVDLVAGGPPCQSFSVAGERKGMDDERGDLTMCFATVVDRYRPRWVVYENVPGVLSSADGRDFGAFLWFLGSVGYGFAYRVLDAQHWGLAQRRERVFLVAHLGDWHPAAAVLFDRSCLSGHQAQGRTAQQATAPRAGDGDGCGHRAFGGRNTSGAIDLATACRAKGGTGHGDFDSETFIAFTGNGEIADPLTVREGKTYSHEGSKNFRMRNVVGTLAVNAGPRSHDAGNFTCSQGVNAGHVFPVDAVSVRRLTPRECERLMGFPDDYTLIPYRGGKPAKDGSRYRVIGNSWAVPVVRWIGERIEAVDALR